jgi:magnesium chelatase subunit I
MVHVPSLAKDLLEQISFEARESEFIDNKSGVSARMSMLMKLIKHSRTSR